MCPAAVPPLGERIREERLRQGVSVRGLAAQIGVSASLISQIETDKSQPSVGTLYAITTALGISVEDLFDPKAPPPQPLDTDAVDTAVDTAGGFDATGPVLRPGGRPVLELDSGVTWERLGQLPGGHVDFLLITYQPGGASSGSGLMRHSGAEYGHVMSGELTLTLGFAEHRLGPGDSVTFDSTTPHRYRNDGAVPAVGVWFVTEH